MACIDPVELFWAGCRLKKSLCARSWTVNMPNTTALISFGRCATP